MNYWQRPSEPTLVFSPIAWLKLNYACHSQATEVGGFGLALDPSKPLYVHDIMIPKQECTSAYTDPDMGHVAELMEDYITEPKTPGEKSYHPGTAIWIHTHPDESATPSITDENTFAERGGTWSIMFILARGGQVTCRLRVGAEGEMRLSREIPVRVDWEALPGLLNKLEMDALVFQWCQELDRVKSRSYTSSYTGGYPGSYQGHYAGERHDPMGFVGCRDMPKDHPYNQIGVRNHEPKAPVVDERLPAVYRKDEYDNTYDNIPAKCEEDETYAYSSAWRRKMEEKQKELLEDEERWRQEINDWEEMQAKELEALNPVNDPREIAPEDLETYLEIETNRHAPGGVTP